MSLNSGLKVSNIGKPLFLVHFDIPRPHFMPKADRGNSVEIPSEGPKKRPDSVGKLNRTWYGMQDASNLYQKHYTTLMEQRGYGPGIL